MNPPRESTKRLPEEQKPMHHVSVNVGTNERWLSIFGAGFLTACGLMRGSLPFLALGAGLAYRGYTGKCHVYEALGYNTAEPDSEEQNPSERPRLIVSE